MTVSIKVSFAHAGGQNLGKIKSALYYTELQTMSVSDDQFGMVFHMQCSR